MTGRAEVTRPADPERLKSWLDRWIGEHGGALVTIRRELHAHPELGRAEHGTTNRIRAHLGAAGITSRVLPGGTGLVCEVGSGSRVVAVRADIDALPVIDRKNVPYRSTVDGVCHACGHDAHTAIAIGTAMALHAAPPPGLPGRVRFVFQPAEEVIPGGALDVVRAGVLDGAEAIFALHCDPGLDAGTLGVRTGPITAAADRIEVTLTGPGGHTSRPHLTADLVYALGRVITETPGMLSRLVDPRHGLSLVWGSAATVGGAHNVVPQEAVLCGTVRVLDRGSWDDAPGLVRRLIESIVVPTGAQVTIDHHRGVPPVDNDPGATALLRAGGAAALGADHVVRTEQSLGGEDFGWYLDHVPGTLGRLGVGRVGHEVDLHQGTFDIDERAIAAGVRIFVHTAHAALRA